MNAVKNFAVRSGGLRRIALRSTSIVLFATMLVLAGCSARDTAASAKSEAQESSSSVVETVSSAPEQPAVELLAGATRYAEVDNTQLEGLIKKKKEEYQEKKVANAPPAAGDIAGWKKTNPDVTGWITIPNTNINYPLIYHTNTAYYTSRGYNKEPSRNGVIWFDGDTRFSASGEITSKNAVIYGHNWTNCWRPVRIGDNTKDVMFGQLAAYDNKEFALANPYIRIATTGGDHLYQVFSVAYIHEKEAKYWYANPPAGQFEKARQASIHDFGVSVSDKDQVITLSTCTRVMGDTSKYRFLVMAKKVQ